MRKILVLFCLIQFSEVHSTATADYYPLTSGNSWFYKGMTGGSHDIFISVCDTFIRHDQIFYIMQSFDRNEGFISYPDTIRKDSTGNIWRYGKGADTLWLDLSADTSVNYNYD